MGGAGPITILGLLLIGVPFVLLRSAFRFSARQWQMGRTQRGPLTPFELNRRRAVMAAFVLVFAVYLAFGLWSSRGQLPLWALAALIGVPLLSFLFLMAALSAARNGPRDPVGVLFSLVIAGGSAFLLWSHWYLPPDWGDAAQYGNPLLKGVYIAALIATLVRARLCAGLIGGAHGVVAGTVQQRSAPMRPARSRRFSGE